MGIKFSCPKCNRSVSAPDNSTGKKALCPGCRNTVIVPAPEAPKPSDDTQLLSMDELMGAFDDGAAKAKPAPQPEPEAVIELTDADVVDDDEFVLEAVEPPLTRPAGTIKPKLPVKPAAVKPRLAAIPMAPPINGDFSPAPLQMPPDGGDFSPAPLSSLADDADDIPLGPPIAPAPEYQNYTAAPAPSAQPAYQNYSPAPSATAVAADAPMNTVYHQPDRTGAFASDCFGSLRVAFRNFGSAFGLVLIVAFIYLGLYLLLKLISGISSLGDTSGTVTRTPPSLSMIVIVLLVVALVFIAISGMIFRFQLSVAQSAIEDADAKADFPGFNPISCIAGAAKALGVAAVYILPIVTIPLLPLGLLGLANSENINGFNVAWALRCAIKKPLQLLMLWAFVILYAIVGVLILAGMVVLLGVIFGAIIASLRESAVVPLYIVGFLGEAVITALWIVMGVIIFYCAGRFGCYNREFLDDLDRRNAFVPMSYIAAGVIISIIVCSAWSSDISDVARKIERAKDDYERMALRQPAPITPPRPAMQPPQLPQAQPAQPPQPVQPVEPVKPVTPVNVRAVALENLHTIHAALCAYTDKNNGNFPVSLNELASGGFFAANVLTNPADASGQYFYISSYSGAPGENILVYGKVDESSFIVLQTNGAIATMSQSKLDQRLQEQAASAAVIASESHARMTKIYAALGAYAAANYGHWPLSLENMAETGQSVEEPKIVAGAKSGYRYISSQNPLCDNRNILLYDPVSYDGKNLLILRVDGTVDSMERSAVLSAITSQSIVRTPMKYRRMPSNVSVPASDMHNLRAGAFLYAMKHKGAFPPNMDELLQDGMTKEEDLHSSIDTTKRLIYIPGRQYQPTIVANNMEILAYDPAVVNKPTVGQFHTVLYTTGTIATLSQDALQLQLQKQGAPEVGVSPTTGPTTGPAAATMPVAAPPADALYDATVKTTWPVPNWTDFTLPADSPWLKVCAVAKQVKFDKNTATVGVAFGPKAASKDDQAYKDFHKAVDEYFLANLKGKDFAHGKQTLGKIEYDRTTVEDGYAKHMLFMGIQNGRCVVFLYTGSPNCFPPFSANLTKAAAE